MRILVCGGRDYDKQAELFQILDQLDHVELVIHGGQKKWIQKMSGGYYVGADYNADLWAHARGIPCIKMEAQWTAHGKSAGPLRNGWMLTYGKPDLVIAFPGGKGTANMVKQAERANIPVQLVP